MNTYNLNSEQLDAVKTVDGRLLILAGAGSGKTRVLTTRMAHLIENCQVLPESILGLTFTNKAAQEMRHRISSLLTETQAKRLTLCTFHSFCMKVLRSEIHHLGFTANFSLYDPKDVERMVKLIARDLLGQEGELPSLTPTLRAISMASQKGLAPHEIAGHSWHDSFTRSVYERLQAGFRAYNAVDFDHLIIFTVELFQKFPQILNRYQERFKFIMIDEYQDTNPIQFKLAEQLSAKYSNLCVVGDDDQSIYGWRGADVANILHFENAKTVKLEQNYRSHNLILKAANAVISHNSSRHPKVLWSKKEKNCPIEIFVTPTEQEEAEAVAARMVRLKEKENLAWNEIAILYRSNVLSRLLELTLLKQRWKSQGQWVTGIPFEVVGGLEFYERREIKDLLAYLRVILNPKDEEAFLRIINLPRRGIGDVALDKMTAVSRKEKRPLCEILEEVAQGGGCWDEIISKRIQSSIGNFMCVLKEAKALFNQRNSQSYLSEALVWLIERINFRKSIEEDVKSDQMRGMKWENVEQLVSALSDYENKLQGEASLNDFVSTMSLNLQADSFAKKNPTHDRVSLMTFHGAKGLEFEACFLIGLEDHLIPHEKSLMETGIEEERRLMYVAMTRAKTWLTLSMARIRKRMGKETPSRPSRFLADIPDELIRRTKWHEVT